MQTLPSNKLHKDAIKTLEEYNVKNSQKNIILLTDYVKNTPKSIQRTNTPGHLTVGGIIIKNDKVLLVFHNTLKRFFQPGGHLELKKDSSLYEAAKREILEETGLKVKTHPLYGKIPIHIDIHKIPANKKKNEPEHLHYDCLFIFIPKTNNIKLQKNEVSKYQWCSLDYNFKDSAIKKAIKKIKQHEQNAN